MAGQADPDRRDAGRRDSGANRDPLLAERERLTRDQKTLEDLIENDGKD
jgi:hypothetical protein